MQNLNADIQSAAIVHVVGICRLKLHGAREAKADVSNAMTVKRDVALILGLGR